MSPSARRLLLLLAAVAVAACIVQTVPRQVHRDAGADLAADYASARDRLEGRDPYAAALPASIRRHTRSEATGGFPENQSNPHSPALIATLVSVAWIPW